MMLNFHEDTLTEIFLRLPAKSIIRFRSLSKSWNALLTNPHFIDKHHKFSQARDNNQVLVVCYKKNECKHLLSFHSDDDFLSVSAPDIDLEDLGYGNSLRLLGSCNGLVCLFNSHQLVLCNPVLRQFRQIPPRPFARPMDFYGETDGFGFGFGFDPITNNYKIVRVTSLVEPDNPLPHLDPMEETGRVEIYSLSDNTWRVLNNVVVPGFIQSYHSGFNLFFNGRIHWYALGPEPEPVVLDPNTDSDSDPELDTNDLEMWILSLDISTELFHKFSFPEAYSSYEPGSSAKAISLTVIDNSLAAILYAKSHSYQKFISIWVMKEYSIEDSWFQQCRIGPLYGIQRPISYWKNNRLLLECASGRCCSRWGMMVSGFDGQLVAIDLLNCEPLSESSRLGKDFEGQLVPWNLLKWEQFEQLQRFDIYSFQCSLDVVFYKESLISIINNN